MSDDVVDSPDRPTVLKREGDSKDSLVTDPSLVDSSSSATESASTSGDDSADAKGYNIRGYRRHLPADVDGPAFSTLTDRDDEEYDLSGGVRLAVVLNQETFAPSTGCSQRQGTEADCEAIKEAFGLGAGFRVEILTDKTFDEIKQLVRQLQANEAKEHLSCLALFVLTHGEENGVLYASDVQYRLDRHLIEELVPERCPSLAGKPKMIFIQACQGKAVDDGADVRVRSRHTSTDSSSNSYRIPNLADFLIFQAAYHGHYSFRSRSGSWFVQALCKEVNASNPDEDIHRVLNRVKRQVSLHKISNVPSMVELDGKRQIPLAQDTLIRDLYLKKNNNYEKSTALTAAQSGSDVSGHSSSLPSTPRLGKKRHHSKGCRVT